MQDNELRDRSDLMQMLSIFLSQFIKNGYTLATTGGGGGGGNVVVTSSVLPTNAAQETGGNLATLASTVNGTAGAMKVEIVGASGTDINITAGDIGVQLSHTGTNPDSVRIGDGTNEVTVDASGNLNVGGTTLDALFASIMTNIGGSGKNVVGTFISDTGNNIAADVNMWNSLSTSLRGYATGNNLVINNDGSLIVNNPTLQYTIAEIDTSDITYNYYGFIKSNGDWYIMREDKINKHYLYYHELVSNYSFDDATHGWPYRTNVAFNYVRQNTITW